MLPLDGELTLEQIDHVRQCVNARCDEQSLNYEQVDDKIGCARKAVRRFMEGRYEHNDSNMARKLDRWLKKSDPALGGMPQAFVSTRIAKKMLGVIDQIHGRKSMGAIIGPSGVSKSTVLAYVEAGYITNSQHIELTSTDKTITQALRRIAGELGLNDQYHTQRLMRNIILHLRGTDRLLMIDEAHYLDKRAMNAIRDIHKGTKCPIVLVGTQDLLGTIDDFDQFHGQMKSLVAMTYNITVEANASSGKPLYTLDEMMEYAKSMNIRLTISGASEVTDQANILGWGGLRLAAYLLLNANLLARGKPVSEKHVNKALLDMMGHDGFQKAKLHSASAKKAAVA